MNKVLRIGTRDSQLAVWQANHVKERLAIHGFQAELVYIKSEGDIDLQTPLYEIGVQGIFTRTLDIALLNNTIDLAVHSMKDVPTRLPNGMVEAAVLERASYKDLFVFKGTPQQLTDALQPPAQQVVKGPNGITKTSQAAGNHLPFTIATSSIRRKALWLNRYPHHTIHNLRGNVNSRLRKVEESGWNGAIFAAAGLDRIHLRPQQSFEIDWMLPAPAQGAIMVVCRSNDELSLLAANNLHHQPTALCTHIEKAFLRTLMGGCTTPISALGQINGEHLTFKGSICSPDGTQKIDIEQTVALDTATHLGEIAAREILANGGSQIAATIQHDR